MADGMAATGITLRLKKDGESAFTDAARVVDITLPTAEMEEIDVSHQLSEWRQKIPNGLKDAGQASFVVNSLIEDFEDGYGDVGKSVDVEVVFPGDTPQAVAFSGNILSFEPGGLSLGEKVEHTINISVSGAVTVGAPSA